MTISVVLPAAGFGSRMKQDLPKALTEFESSTFLKWQIDKFKNIAKEIFVIVSVKDVSTFEEYRKSNNLDFTIVIQKRENGSYFAIDSVIDVITTEFLIICWVDQVGMSKSLVLETINKIDIFNSDGIVPLLYLNKPYVKANLSESGTLIGWEYRR